MLRLPLRAQIAVDTSELERPLTRTRRLEPNDWLQLSEAHVIDASRGTCSSFN